MTFKDLSKKKKLEYIWDYYKLHIIGTILAVLALSSLVYTMFIRVPDTNFCGVAIYGQFLSALNTDKMTADLNKELNLPEHTSVQLQNFYSDSTDVMVEADLNQKFNTYVYALEFHLLLSNAENTKNFTQVEYTTPITDYLSDEKVNELRKKGLVLDIKPYGISLKDSKILKKYNLFQNDTPYISFVPIVDNTENTLKTLDILMEE
jgi:hypothetical protein